jgi:hypothetical protein
MSKLIVKDLEGPSSSSNKIYIASGSQLDIAGSPDGASAINLAVDAADIASGTLANARLANGHVLQVVSATTTSPASFSSSTTNTFVDLSGLTVSITPTSASSKILVFFTVNVTRSSSATQHVRLMRDTTAIAIGDQAGSNRLRDTVITRDSPGGDEPYEYWIGNLNGSYLDSPSTTSATVYKLQGTLGASYSGTFYINQCNADGDNDYSGRPISTITVMEIKA